MEVKVTDNAKGPTQTELNTGTETERSTNAPFLAFGGRRHRCSGQAFALHFKKMVVSYLVKYYEIEPLAARPKNWEIADTVLPPRVTVVRVRHRVAGK
ncbi:hypothetical protein BDW69DRAFT_180851 [Aspergillus filifer]